MESKYEAVIKNIDLSIEIYKRVSCVNQVDIASKVGLSESQFIAKRAGKYEWKLDELMRLAEIIGKEPADLISPAAS